jgi:hypothetical protein
MFYTTPTDDGAMTVTCDRCLVAVACPDPFAAAAAITHHHCDPDAAMAGWGAAGHPWTASRRRCCTCWPAAGSPPAPPVGSSWPAPEAKPAANARPSAPAVPSATRTADAQRRPERARPPDTGCRPPRASRAAAAAQRAPGPPATAVRLDHPAHAARQPGRCSRPGS